ncbi:MAG: hypothetical protein FJ096_01530 [Deltaproteobacteria bacterium]|nr:hypothetical protein [Deltaproteobacteria bacterium]
MNPSTCPHGNHVATTNPHPELRQICGVCGGPRVASGAPTSGGEVAALEAAKDAYTRRTSWRFGAGCSAAIAAFSGVVGLALLRLDHGWATTVAVPFLLLAAPFALVFITGLLKSARHSKELAQQIASAWSRAARDVALAAGRPIDAATLAHTLGSTEEEADRWLAELSVSGVVRSEVTDDGQIVYQPPARLRVDTEGSRPATARPTTGSAEGMSDADAELEARFAELARREAERKA